jgi:chloride channel protein, CIC family
VLAPLLMIGGAVGAMAGHLAHSSVEAQAFWALIGMGAMLAGALGVPLTAILFSLEVTHCLPALLPLTMACIASYLVTSLLMPRSILTEKLSRRGYHLTREYGVDPLELVIVRELMSPFSIPASVPGANAKLPEFYAYADGTARGAAEIMAMEGLETLMVIDRGTRQACGTISLSDLLRGRVRTVERENERLRLFDHVPPERGGHN